MVIAAIVILLIYVADAMVGQGEEGFLPMTAEERGRTFGTSSMILFLQPLQLDLRNVHQF